MMFSHLQYALIAPRERSFGEDVRPFQSSKTKAALAAFFLFVSSSFRTSATTSALGDIRRYPPRFTASAAKRSAIASTSWDE